MNPAPARVGSRHIGIVGGGQLALMLCRAATSLGHRTTVLDPDAAAPAASVADTFLTGDLHDASALRALADGTDVVTIELENVDVDALAAIEAAGRTVIPSPALLARLVNKLRQKNLLQELGLPTSRFVTMDDPSGEALQAFGLPCVQKLQRGGYDGRGVAIIRTPADFDRILPAPSLIEAFVACRAELAVVVARAADGTSASYAPVELIFDPALHVLDALVSPARLGADLDASAQRLAEETVNRLGGVGVYGVELFLSQDGELLVNEISPRVHNSGHHTLEACATSQFEQHVRIVTGTPLGSTAQPRPAAMVNVLGEPGSHGPAVIRGFDAARAIPGVTVHLYGKRECRPGRKMGHITALDMDVDQALKKAREARALIHVTGAIPDV
jgi:5-(carboxyamino)imidazole ribonucleotide synthase